METKVSSNHLTTNEGTFEAAYPCPCCGHNRVRMAIDTNLREFVVFCEYDYCNQEICIPFEELEDEEIYCDGNIDISGIEKLKGRLLNIWNESCRG